MKCVIIKNGFVARKSQREQIVVMKDKLEQRGVATEIRGTDELISLLDENGVRSVIGEADFVLYLDKDPYISVLLEKSGYKLVNTAESIESCDDKMKTYIALSGKVPMPKTISAPLNYTMKEDDFHLVVEKELNYPIVVKEVYGSLGKGVYIANDVSELGEIHKRLNFKPHLFQNLIGKGGEDVRVIVIGKKAVAAMKRINDKDFRSNVELGGKGVKIEPNAEIKKLSETCADVLNLDYCGVDILCDGENYFVCEVNSNAFFNEIVRVTGIDVPGIFADYLVERFGAEK